MNTIIYTVKQYKVVLKSWTFIITEFVWLCMEPHVLHLEYIIPDMCENYFSHCDETGWISEKHMCYSLTEGNL